MIDETDRLTFLYGSSAFDSAVNHPLFGQGRCGDHSHRIANIGRTNIYLEASRTAHKLHCRILRDHGQSDARLQPKRMHKSKQTAISYVGTRKRRRDQDLGL